MTYYPYCNSEGTYSKLFKKLHFSSTSYLAGCILDLFMNKNINLVLSF